MAPSLIDRHYPLHSAPRHFHSTLASPQSSFSSFASFLSQLAHPRPALLHGGRLLSRCHLLTLPPPAQCGLLCLLIDALPLLPSLPHADCVWSLLDEHGAKLVEERREAANGSVGHTDSSGRGSGSSRCSLLHMVECDMLLLTLRSIYTRCCRPLPTPLLSVSPAAPPFTVVNTATTANLVT